MPRRSAGLLMYRGQGSLLEVLLVHPGGPFWASRDLGAWSIPKGEYHDGEAALDAAKREFHEETGFDPEGAYVPLGEIQQNSTKRVTVWGFEGDADPSLLRSNVCQFEWPPRSGRHIDIPEVDRAAWFTMDEARRRILNGQRPFLDRLAAALAQPQPGAGS